MKVELPDDQIAVIARLAAAIEKLASALGAQQKSANGVSSNG